MNISEIRYCKRVASLYYYTVNGERYNVSKRSNKELFEDYIVLREKKNKYDITPTRLIMLIAAEEVYKSYFTVLGALKARGFKIKEEIRDE